MEKIVLKAEKRDVVGKQVKALRRMGKLPAVVYGSHVEPMPIVLEAHETNLTLSRVSSSALITISLDGKEYPTLIREKQRNYIKGVLTHIDFLAVAMDEKLTATVAIEFHGEAPAVKNFNATLVHNLNEVEVECFPADLPEAIVVDVSKIAEVGDAVYVRDLVVSEKVEILAEADDVVVVATAAEEELTEEEAGPAEPEVIERGKKEEIED